VGEADRGNIQDCCGACVLDRNTCYGPGGVAAYTVSRQQFQGETLIKQDQQDAIYLNYNGTIICITDIGDVYVLGRQVGVMN
jgi:hypothetical protein